MALEVAPAPAKATPAKSPAQAASGRADSVDGSTKPAGGAKGKGSEVNNPAGFLTLLMGLEQDPTVEAITDPTTHVPDAAEPDLKEAGADSIATQPTQVTATPMPTPDTTALPGIAAPESSRLQIRTDDKMRLTPETMAVDVSDSAKAGVRRRSSPLTDTMGQLGTQQLQIEPSKESSIKQAELTMAREGKIASRTDPVALQMPASLQAPIAIDESRKGSHFGQAKVEAADNLVVLSSGLSSAQPAPGVADVGPSDGTTQFQSVVAQEVAYYVSKDVQSAEMKLEGVGGGPVEVSINMQGQEAQVVFRTDETHTREMLEGATTQLKDMLQQQGVVLTGVFVGGSSAGDARQQQERKFRQGSRSETTLRIASPELRGARASAAGVGRTLDLFV